jgi:hypothetical protein
MKTNLILFLEGSSHYKIFEPLALENMAFEEGYL